MELSPDLTQKLDLMARRHAELSDLLAQAETGANPSLFARLSKEYAELDPVVEARRTLRDLEQQLQEAIALLEDPEGDRELQELAQEERESLKEQIDQQQRAVQLLLLPKDPNDGKNIVLEIRAGTGGEEAGLFAADLFRMYCRYAELRNWRVETLSSSATALGGFKEVIALISGAGVYSTLKFESGAHRVQRVPVTEAGGRIHTSACTVAILPEADEVDVQINERDELRIDVFRASGPGGQSVNTTDSAVRVTHLPTGLVVICQDEKSQHKNKAQAIKVLKARLFDMQQRAAHDERSRDRRDQVGSGDRSERIRTYNFPQGRVTDHRIHLTLHKLDQVLQGDLVEIVESLAAHHQAETLARLSDGDGI
ncbi:MAG: peptide chain release factor 1 [Magnetococcales bacterium]|nr:peptide chain release factor 1 [Magnetococcales bacterium]MBF0115460.1 peptide chain release factor 1 [Magnetococcales bacterium]